MGKLTRENDEQKLKEKLEEGIRKGLCIYDEGPQVPKLEGLKIVAVIDEAGADPFYGEVRNLCDLRNGVQEEFPSCCCHLVVSGTGLDLLTNAIGSAGEGITKLHLSFCSSSYVFFSFELPW